MGQVLHGSAKTTHMVRAGIQCYSPCSRIRRRVFPIKMRRAVLICLISALLAACTTASFKADITQFHDLDAIESEQRFVIRPTDDAKESSLEFAAHARRVAVALERHGFRHADDLSESDFVVFFDYAVGAGEVRTYPVPVYGFRPDRSVEVRGVTSEGERFRARYTDTGGFEPIGVVQRSETLYRWSLAVDIVDRPAWQQGRTVRRYEARVMSQVRDVASATVVPRLIAALFQTFPGDGESATTIELSP